MKNRVKTILARAKQTTIKEFSYSRAASRPKKILFDHLPKCGGSALNAYLKAHYPRRRTFATDGYTPIVSVDEFKKLPERKRYSYDLVKGHLAHELLDFVHPECVKVTVLREPVERIVSHYYYAKRNPAHYLHGKIHDSDMGLEEYASSDLSGELRNWYTTHYSGMTAEDAESCPEESVANAFEVVNRYDVVGFLDNFPTFAETLRSLANLRCEYQNVKVNATEDRPALDRVDPAALATIQQVNHLDIALYQKIRDAVG